jgi:short-subunit dehydrogenase
VSRHCLFDPSPVVVLTGASSGIGRATALALARAGATLVLAARHHDALRDVADEARHEAKHEAARAGVDVQGAARSFEDPLVVLADVTAPAQVRALRDAALARFGRIDAWINMVGVGAIGAFVEVPLEVHRRVIEASLLGHVHGAHVALEHFVARGRGTLIQMISLGAWAATPYAAAYTASKFALRGFSRALRAEVSRWPDIHVCDVYPGFVDAPGVQHGANYSGRRVKPAPPLLDPRQVADTIVALLARPRATTMIGASTYAARAAHALAPEAASRLTARYAERALARATPMPVTSGNLFAPSRGHAIDGGWREEQRPERVAAGVVGSLALALLTAGALVGAVLGVASRARSGGRAGERSGGRAGERKPRRLVARVSCAGADAAPGS